MTTNCPTSTSTTDPDLQVVLQLRRNSQDLATQIESLLEELTEMTREVEVIVVEGSDEEENQVSAQELARSYPQIRRVVTCDGRSLPTVVDSMMGRLGGRKVLSFDIEQRPGHHELRAATAGMKSRPKMHRADGLEPVYCPSLRGIVSRLASRRAEA